MKTPKKGISCDKSPKNAMSCEIFLSQLWHFFGNGREAAQERRGSGIEAAGNSKGIKQNGEK